MEKLSELGKGKWKWVYDTKQKREDGVRIGRHIFFPEYDGSSKNTYG